MFLGGVFENQEPQITTKDELRKYIQNQNTLIHKSTHIKPTSECLICCEAKVDIRGLSRSCLMDVRPCEGHTCQCKEVHFCIECIVTLLWQNTNSVLKRDNVFRYKCPLCKAEFCQRDVLLV